jgi:diguanylate cyclase (GGDEF)-like protein/PAS domain S-box-containing protein
MPIARDTAGRALARPIESATPRPGPAPPTDVQARLTEAEETLRAIRHGEVDALVVRDDSPAAQVFTLSSADRPYRIFVENMRDGAATVSDSGIILYGNHRLAELLARPLRQVIGSPITSFIADGDRRRLQEISASSGTGGTTEAELIASDGRRIPVRINAATHDVDTHELLCLTFADLSEQNAQRREIDHLQAVQAERMTELEAAQAALIEQATHDALTGLPNRGLLIDRLTQTLAVAQRSGSSTGLIFVDLDDFKEINDTEGHAAGDIVLHQVAQRLLSAVRPMDSVSRLGGDEFVTLLPAVAGSADVIAVATRIAAVMGSPIELGHGPVSVRASIGISVTEPSAGEEDPDPDRLLSQADTAMYHAKSLGGARTEFFDSDRTPTVRQADRDMWNGRIRQALDDDRFVLHRQPIVKLATGEVVQHELLLRMRDESDHLIRPLAFLPTAERSGLITEIDHWVIAQAARIAAGGQSVGVNLSATAAGDPRLLDLIDRELRKHAADPSKLAFEIAETAVVRDMDRATVLAERLRALGCAFALDDFGTGFASFTYLERLPVQYLKIDSEFVTDVVRSKRDMFVVRAIVALAGDFGQQTIAEGVEDEQTAGLLQELGVTFAQGYLFGRPEPISSTEGRGRDGPDSPSPGTGPVAPWRDQAPD